MKGFQNLSVRESKNKYREVFESLGDAVFLADEDSGEIIDTNRRAEKLLGCARSEILGNRQSQFLPSLDQGGTNFEESIESELIRPDGSSLSVRINSTQLTVYERRLVLRLCQELTKWDPRQRQNAEAEH